MSDDFLPGLAIGVVISVCGVMFFGDETSYDYEHDYAKEVCSKNQSYREINSSNIGDYATITCIDGAEFNVRIIKNDRI
jgi:hypothetical protein